ncbi:MAG: hypothetical protein R3E39_11480 [Anaerolineae bacterium]
MRWYGLFVILCGLLVGCGTLANEQADTIVLPTYTSLPSPTPATVLAARVRQLVAPYPQGNWCDQSVNRQPIDNYNNSLVGALAHLLADTRTANMTAEELVSTYVDGARLYPQSLSLATGGNTVLAALPTYRVSCLESNHYRPVITRIVLFDRKGHHWQIKQGVTTAESGTLVRSRDALQWSDDRWVVLLNSSQTRCFQCFEVIHILPQDDGYGWLGRTVLKGTDDSPLLNSPTLGLVDGYQEISLTFVRYDPPPCLFETTIRDRYAWTINTIERRYRWNVDQYKPSGERTLETKVILYAGEQRQTYERLMDWSAHCVI